MNWKLYFKIYCILFLLLLITSLIYTFTNVNYFYEPMPLADIAGPLIELQTYLTFILFFASIFIIIKIGFSNKVLVSLPIYHTIITVVFLMWGIFFAITQSIQGIPESEALIPVVMFWIGVAVDFITLIILLVTIYYIFFKKKREFEKLFIKLKKSKKKPEKISIQYNKVKLAWNLVALVSYFTIIASFISIFAASLQAYVVPPMVLSGLVIFFIYKRGKKSNRFDYLTGFFTFFLIDAIILAFLLSDLSVLIGLVVRIFILFYLYRGINALKEINLAKRRKVSWKNGILIGIGIIALSILLGVLWGIFSFLT